jgi:hypothetical protein
MRLMWLHTQACEVFRVTEHLASLFRQGGQRSGELVLPGYTDGKDLLSFLASRHPTKSRQAKGDASGIRGLAPPVALAYPEKRFDRIGTDRQADLIKS